MTFLPDIVEEHAEEAAFLYDQRSFLRRTGQDAWPLVGVIEDRMEAHLDGLLIAGPAGVEAAAAWADRDPGAAWASAEVLAKTDAIGAAATLAGGTRSGAFQDAVASGLRRAAPPSWSDAWATSLAGDGPFSVALAADVVGAQRIALGEAVLDALDAARATEVPALIGALSELRYWPALSVLFHRHLRSDDPSVAAAAALALVRFGEPRAVEALDRWAQEGRGPVEALAVAGRRSAGATLAQSLALGSPGASVAAGLFGDVRLVPALIDHLDTDPAGAALGLYIMTGGIQDGGRVSGPAGPETERGRRAWDAWWDRHSDRFEDSVRYRLGQPATASTVVASAMAPGLSPDVRRWIRVETRVRYGVEIKALYDDSARTFRNEVARHAHSLGTLPLVEAGWAVAPATRL